MLTARRYNSVSVPPTGGWHVFLLSGYKIRWVLRVSRYKIEWEQVGSHGTPCLNAGSGAVAVQFLQICHGCRSKSKNRDNCVSRSFLRPPKLSLTSVALAEEVAEAELINYTVRVSIWTNFNTYTLKFRGHLRTIIIGLEVSFKPFDRIAGWSIWFLPSTLKPSGSLFLIIFRNLKASI